MFQSHDIAVLSGEAHPQQAWLQPSVRFFVFNFTISGYGRAAQNRAYLFETLFRKRHHAEEKNRKGNS